MGVNPKNGSELNEAQRKALNDKLIFCENCMFWSQHYGYKYDAIGNPSPDGEYGHCTRIYSELFSQNPGTIQMVAACDFCSFGVSVEDSRGKYFIYRCRSTNGRC